jgi:hypoxanthine phosphoribosyltransferase
MNAPVILRSSEEIAQRVDAIAQQISRDYAGRSLDVVYMVNGASMLCADLTRRLDVLAQLHPLGFSSYPAASPSGEVRLTLDVAKPLHGRHVLLVEGIIVSGRTPRYVSDLLRLRQPASLSLCALGIKPRALAVELPVAYPLFEFGDEIVVGYGVGDEADKALPYLARRK